MIDGLALWATLIVGAPGLVAIFGLVKGLGPRRAAFWGAGASAVSVALAAGLLARGPAGVTSIWTGSPAIPLAVSWRLEVPSLALAVLVAAIGWLVLQYAGRYFENQQGAGRTVALLALFESAMLGLILADNLLLLYVFWELTGLCSFFLISSDLSKGDKGLRAARDALLVTVAGGLFLLVGLLLLVERTGTASLTAVLDLDLDPGLQTLVLALVLPAVLTKSALVPTHFWLPGAMAAPTPVSAYLHSATMVKAGIVLLLYLYPALGASPLWSGALVPLGAATCIWGSLRALAQSDIKMLMAWSTVSQLGLITLTIGLGTDVAVRAAILHVFAHAIFKAGLFLTVGGVDHVARTRSLPQLGGLWRRVPLLAAVAAVLAGSMAGIPPLAGFLSKELILKKAMMADLWTHSVAIAAIVLGSIGTVAYSSRFYFEVFAGEPRSAAAAKAGRLPAGLLMAPLVLAAATLAAGPLAPWVDRWFLEPVAFSVVGGPLEVKPLSLWYGINAALLLSLTIVLIGYLTDRWLGLRFLRRQTPRWWHGPELFEALLKSAQKLGGYVAHLLSSGSPRIYLALAVACGLLPSLVLLPSLLGLDWRSPDLAGAAVAVALAVLLAFLVASDRPLPRVLILTAVGFAVAVLFRLANGPDLMLTQLLVEVLVTIFFALALWTLPADRRMAPGHRERPRRLLRALLASASGLAAASWVAALARSSPDDSVADYVREVAPVIAQGENLVNVVLTDVRAVDTLMETLVVLLGTLGVVALLKGRERDAPRRGDPGLAPSRTGAHGLLPGLAKALLPIGFVFAIVLLAKGHNDPGGGFVAGLSLAVTAMLSLVAFGSSRWNSRLEASFTGAAVVGFGMMLMTGTLGWIVDRPFMTQLHGGIGWGGLSIPLHTTLLFDVGVMLTVAGGIGAAGSAFWTTAARRSGGEQRP